MGIETLPARIANILLLSEEPAPAPAPAITPSEPKAAEPTDQVSLRYFKWSPNFRFSISQVTAGGDSETDSPEMEETLNTRTPFLKLSLSPWNNSIPETYDIFGNRKIDTPRSYIIPNAEISYAKNYSVEEADYDLSGKASASLYIHIDDMSGEDSDHAAVITLNGHGDVFKRQWPSLAMPSGYERGGGLSVSLIYNFTNWLEMRPSLTSDVSFQRYYEESFGHDTGAFNAGLFAGGELYFKYFNILDPRAPVIGLEGSGTVAASQETPELDNPAQTSFKDYNQWKVGGGLYWDDWMNFLTLKGSYERKELEGLNSIWKAEGTASMGSQRTGVAELTAGTARGGYHFYSIDTPWFADLSLRSPEVTVTDLGNLRSTLGFNLSLARYRDNQIQGKPEYDVYGIQFLFGGNY